MHCQNSKFLSNKQLGILWKPFAASTASSVVRGFWMNIPLHLVHLDISRSSLIINWKVSMTCINWQDMKESNLSYQHILLTLHSNLSFALHTKTSSTFSIYNYIPSITIHTLYNCQYQLTIITRTSYLLKPDFIFGFHTIFLLNVIIIWYLVVDIHSTPPTSLACIFTQDFFFFKG